MAHDELRSSASCPRSPPCIPSSGAIAEILVGQLPALERIVEPTSKSAQLFISGHVQKQLDEPRVLGDQHALEVIDLFVGPMPFGRLGEALDALDEDAAVPGAVENDDLAVLWQALPKTLEVIQRLLTLARSRDRMHLEAYAGRAPTPSGERCRPCPQCPNPQERGQRAGPSRERPAERVEAFIEVPQDGARSRRTRPSGNAELRKVSDVSKQQSRRSS